MLMLVYKFWTEGFIKMVLRKFRFILTLLG